MTPLQRALRSLEGLSVGDGFGFRVLTQPQVVRSRTLPEPVWRWSDDTHMALSVVEVLREHGTIDQDALALAFARRYQEEPGRGYGQGARKLLDKLGTRPWEVLARELFQGGSYGNGAAMRVGPLGAWFADEPAQAVQQAVRQAAITHAHPAGQAGAIAVAVAAALLTSSRSLAGRDLLGAVLESVPRGEVHDGLRQALTIAPDDLARAVQALGTGDRISAQDTVPFCLWCTAHHADSYEDALWTTIAGEGDGDTTCAIVGSLVALRSPPPAAWIAAREALPAGFSLSP